MNDKETYALSLTILYFLILAMPWIYSTNTKLFNALAIIALDFLGLIAAVVIVLLVFSYFLNLLDGE